MNADKRVPLLEARGLTKTFPGVKANDAVNLKVLPGEILGLLGENGAGKSTLVKMFFGIYTPDEGEVLINGEVVNIANPSDAISRGIAMVHQHFQLVGPLSVADNIVLGAEPRKGLFVDHQKADKDVLELAEKFGFEIDPTAIVEDLPVGVQQRVEILKALYRGAKVLILDEPTAVLTPKETDELLQVMRDLASSGVGIVFITHKLREVLAVTDRVTVLRGGKVAGHAQTAGSTQASLAELMVGRSVVLNVHKDEADPAEVVLEVQGLKALDDRGHPALRGLDLQVRRGEIVGVAGVEGNGQRELVECITGIRRPTDGEVHLLGQNVTGKTPRAVATMGVAHVPEDREKDGVVGSYSIADNMVLNRYFNEPFSKSGVRQFSAINKNAEELVERYQVATPSIYTHVSSLSGGNKQKVIVARELSTENQLVIASQPTRGVDVGSIEFIHQQIVAERDGGAAVLVVSAELDEIFSLADRIAVLFEGEVVAVLDAKDATRESVGVLMAGGSVDH